MKRKSALRSYHQKRDFGVTPEPKGEVAGDRKAGLRFVIQKHDASRLHYDFRLELEGTLKSWAVPKGPSFDPKKKSLAVHVEDHPMDYGDFEGVIPKGEYGGGTVLLWDRGTWEPLHDPRSGYRAGKLHFVLHGHKLQGEWSLVRMHGRAGGDGKNWLLMKNNDSFASSRRDILAEAPESVKSRRSLQRIGRDRDDVWSDEARTTATLDRAQKSVMPGNLSPQLAVLAEHPPAGDQWLHEIKFDGYRLLAFVNDGKVRLLSRRGLDWTRKFYSIAQPLSKLQVDSAILDGEAVVLDSTGRSDFQALQSTLHDGGRSAPVFYAFDLPFCDGVDLRNVPLIQRKERLEHVLERSHLAPRINYSDHVRGQGERVIEKACGMALEGIVSKKLDAPYVSRRDPTWLKSKCENRQEFVIIGYTDPQGLRTGFGSLLLGYYDEQHRLVYAGRVGTGFDERGLRELLARLKTLGQDRAPTDGAPPDRERRHAHWVRPSLVAEVRFRDWTRDGVLRHPAFVGLRSDKLAEKVVREKPIAPEKLGPLARASRRSAATARAAPRPVSGEAFQIDDVTLSHPDKPLFPDQHITKREVAEYYDGIQEWMLPHVVDRPLSLLRCPDGLASKCFFQRNWNDTMPPDIDKVEVGDGKKREQHVAVHDIHGIISMVQLSVLEIHCWNCSSADIHHPDQLVFDLDPGPDLPWKRMIEGARAVHEMLDSLHLPSFVKTSGGKGLHLTVPIEPNIDWGSAKAFSKTIAEALAQGSELFVANMRKDLRAGKIYVDFNRNDHFATAVAPYSTRGRAGAAVSMPIAWSDLGRLRSADQFTVENAAAHCRRRKSDPWADFDRSRVDLRKVIERKQGS